MKHLVIFVKAPEAGRVKTRLARDIGNHPAAQLYRLMTADIIRRLTNDTRWTSWLAVTPDYHEPIVEFLSGRNNQTIANRPRPLPLVGRVREGVERPLSKISLDHRRGLVDPLPNPPHKGEGISWSTSKQARLQRGARQRKLSVIRQGSGDLGARMNRVFQNMPPGPVVIIGSDCPAMRPGHIAGAFAALGDNDAVLGPSEDGGYWLIGLKRIPRVPKIFADVRWSSPHTLGDTLESFPKDWRIGVLPTLRDIDTLEDLRAYSQDSP